MQAPALFLALTVASSLLAGKASAQTTELTPTIRSTSTIVLVPTQVQTHKGDMLYGLKPEQFTLLDNGVPQTVRVEEDSDAQGLALVVVVQCSRAAWVQFGRMQGLSTMLDEVMGGAPGHVALVLYGTEIELLTPFTSSKAKLAKAFTDVLPCEDEKNAVTLDAVAYANKLFESSEVTRNGRERRAILLIGETRDHGSHVKPAEVVAELGRSNTVVDAVSFNPGQGDLLAILGGTAPDPVQAINLIVQALRKNVPHTLTRLSGGEYTNFSSLKGFESGLHRLSNHVHNFYLLSYRPTFAPDNPGSPGIHRITVKIPDYPDAKIRARVSYYAGDGAPPEIPPELPEETRPAPAPAATPVFDPTPSPAVRP